MSRINPESARRRAVHSRAASAAYHHPPTVSADANSRLFRARAALRVAPTTSQITGAGVPQAETVSDNSRLVAVMDLPAPQLASVATRPRILIVEDDPRVAHVIRETLALEGDAEWAVEVATEGTRALALAYAAPPTLVLLDVRLPDLDGAEVYRRLRAEARTNAARVLFLTAGTSFDLHQQGIEDGVLLRKPFDLDALVSLVRALIAA